MVAMTRSLSCVRLAPKASGMLTGLLLVSTTLAFETRAQESTSDATPEEERREQIERLRAEMTNRVHLQANDLVDELVFSWMQAPPFATPTPVVLADVITPIGFGSGLEALIENHLAQVLVKNPGTNVQLAHCPACSALVVHSDATGTILARGVDSPGALEKLRGSSGAQHTLFLDFEAEGANLVLRARITSLSDNLPIVYARTVSTATSSAALLRSPSRLLSAQETREEYVAILEERGPISIPVRMAITGFAPSEDATLQSPLPVPWLQIGFEYAISSARSWTGSLMLGATFIPTLQTGAMVQARIARLITGGEASLTHPNLYAFLGTSLAVMQGQTASILNPPVDPPEDQPFGPVSTWFGVQTGLELRVSRRIGASVVFETMPTHYESENVGNYLDMLDTGFEFGIFQINSIGVEATFAF